VYDAAERAALAPELAGAFCTVAPWKAEAIAESARFWLGRQLATPHLPQGAPTTAPTQSRTSSSSARFIVRRGGVGREAWYSNG
jgi:hypothetical protein